MMLGLHAIATRKSRISELPYDIVVSIVSSLTIKEAIATSILSRRWRHMWKYTTGSWRFYEFELCAKHVGIKCSHEYDEWGKQTVEDYVTQVNQALELHRGPFLYELGFCLYITSSYLASSYTRVIDNWISIASRKGVRRIDLEIPKLDLNKIVQTLPAFPQVTHLTLKWACFTEETLCYFLCSCLSLEHLCVIDCMIYNYTDQPVKLKLGGDSSLKLKHLEISDCYQLSSLEISAPNLVSFVCKGLCQTTALFKDVPLLSTLFIGECYVQYCHGHNLKMIEPLSYVSQIERLTLELSDEDNRNFCYGLNQPNLKLSKLKYLELRIRQHFTFSFLPYTWLLKASPLLSSLKIDLGTFRFRRSEVTREKGSGNWRKHEMVGKEGRLKHDQANIYRHQCLRVVTLCGFLGYQRDIEFALHLIGMATSLEKMVIVCSQEIPTLTPESCRKERSIARQSAEELRSKLSPTTKFIVL